MSATVHRLPVAANSNEAVAQAKEGSLNQGSYAVLVQSYAYSILGHPPVNPQLNFPHFRSIRLASITGWHTPRHLRLRI